MNKRMKFPIHQYFLFIVFCLLFFQCVNIGNSSFEEIAPEAFPQPVSYQEHIAPIVEHYCASCHSENATKSVYPHFNSYQILKVLWPSFKKAALVELTMPLGGKERVPPFERELLLKWEDENFGY